MSNVLHVLLRRRTLHRFDTLQCIGVRVGDGLVVHAYASAAGRSAGGILGHVCIASVVRGLELSERTGDEYTTGMGSWARRADGRETVRPGTGGTRGTMV